jgi:hypothetical protein
MNRSERHGRLTETRSVRFAGRTLLAAAIGLSACLAWAGQSGSSKPGVQALPEASRPQAQGRAAISPTGSPAGPCELTNAGATMAATAANRAEQVSGADESAVAANPGVAKKVPCGSHRIIINWYDRFVDGPQVKPLTPLEKAHLAVRNLIDPYNLLTIAGVAGISVAANSHSPYGPGMPGYGRYVGVSFTQDMTGEFFGTFLIPSIVHQDPHYHRMPNAPIPRRIVHAISQVAWTQGDNGKGMVNYADLVGFAIDDEFGNFYVPGQQTNLRASAERYAIDVATAPIDNFITEFLPDVARRIHVRVVLVQRIVNQVARTDNAE